MIDSINIDERSSFSIELEINGDIDSTDKPIVRFNLINENYRLVFDAKRVDNGIYEVTIPELKNMLNTGEYMCEFDVFLGNKHFIPIKEKIKLTENIKPKMQVKTKKETVKEEFVSMKVNKNTQLTEETNKIKIEKLDIVKR